MDINQALGCTEEVGILSIKENENCGFIEEILNQNLIKLTKKSKELKLKDKYFALLVNISQSALEFMEKSVMEEAKKPQWEKCGIVLKKVFSKQDGKDLLKILNKINL